MSDMPIGTLRDRTPASALTKVNTESITFTRLLTLSDRTVIHLSLQKSYKLFT
ncbi:hypothetical protein H6S82_30795 [Planktothrix sp. FACHB-1355]|uniref:Uncharacterized protein n=1 Tax=Aerosakkonema funiforme FACHB-1375 TaxID=2949571 RepID=A0A926VM46_9CYAN|nr:hypothetical protein [Aerosakkonema funiforme FACHB-1375]MBD3563193.1 hypothetical protein [Planktothrix sp. FACHB-1355]